MAGTFVIDCFPESAPLYRDRYAVVAIDVMRATTTAVTAVGLGKLVFPVASVEEAFALAREIPGAILVGEQKGEMPAGFDMTNSPVRIAKDASSCSAIILVSSSGTKLIVNAAGKSPVYAGCFRNLSAMANHLTHKHDKVALIGAGTRQEFRREDQMGCAYLGQKLASAGYRPENRQTAEICERWYGVDHREAAQGRSAHYLRRSGQIEDLDFILDNFDDLDLVPELENGALVPVRKAPIYRPEIGPSPKPESFPAGFARV